MQASHTSEKVGKMYTFKRSRDYSVLEDIIPIIVDDWLEATTDGIPVLGWPFEGQLKVFLKGHILSDQQEKTKLLIKAYFDNDSKTCLFPIKGIEFQVGKDCDSGENVTAISIVGDRDRAHEMVRPV